MPSHLLANIVCRGLGGGGGCGEINKETTGHDDACRDDACHENACRDGQPAIDQLDWRRVVWMQIGWSAFGIALFLWTSPLWLGTTQFPQVPLVTIGHWLPRAMDPAWFAIAVGCVTWVLLYALTTLWWGSSTSSSPRAPLAIFVVAFVPLAIGNLHRLQPWAYLAWLTAIAMLCRPRSTLVALRILVISIYFHSALSKCDHAFVTTLGMTFWEPIKTSIGLSIEGERLNQLAVFVFPLTEFLVAVGLIFRIVPGYSFQS